VSEELYGVPPEAVIGTLVEYDFVRRDDGSPTLHRTNRVHGVANEGAAKVGNIQTQLGRRPLLAAGNSGGGREMLEWAGAAGEPYLALLIDHDDDDASSTTRARRRPSPRRNRSRLWAGASAGPW